MFAADTTKVFTIIDWSHSAGGEVNSLTPGIYGCNFNTNYQTHFSEYRQTSNISCTLVGNKVVDHSDVVGASPVGAAPTTPSFSTKHLASLDWAKTTARWDEKHLSFGIWRNFITGLTVIYQLFLMKLPTGEYHKGPSLWVQGPFQNTYELLNQRDLKISMLYKNCIFRCMGKIFCVEFQRFPLKFHLKYLIHTLKDVHFIYR